MNLHDQKGLALVETALSLMLLFTLLFAITEFGRALYITNTLTNAAREGARLAAVSPSSLDIAALKAHVRSVIPFDQTDLNVDIRYDGVLTHAQTPIVVEVTIPFHPLVPFVQIRDGLVLKGQAQMLYE